MSDWRHRAACRAEDPELFFPIGNGTAAQEQIAEAKSVCSGCPVVSECLAWALESGQDSGIWGGMTDNERRVLSRRIRVIGVMAGSAAFRLLPAER